MTAETHEPVSPETTTGWMAMERVLLADQIAELRELSASVGPTRHQWQVVAQSAAFGDIQVCSHRFERFAWWCAGRRGRQPNRASGLFYAVLDGRAES